MDLGVISVRYARALLKCATGLKLEDQVYKEMQTLSRSFLEVPELRFTIDNPMLPKDKKAKLIATACGDGVCDLTKKFVDLVLRDDREKTLQFMAASYITLYRKQKNIIRGSPHHCRSRLKRDRGQNAEDGGEQDSWICRVQH